MADRCGNTTMYAGSRKINYERDEPTVLRDGVAVPVSGKRVPEGEAGVNRHDLRDGEIITLNNGTRVRYDGEAALGRAGRNATEGLLITSEESRLLDELGAPDADVTAHAEGYSQLLQTLGEDTLRERVLDGARAAHAQWASDFVANLEPDAERVRWKDDGMGGQVDILNTPFDELPRKWQEENLAQTVSAMAAVSGVPAVVTEPTEVVERAAATIHEQWLARNPWAPPEQQLPYRAAEGEPQLSEEEREKDRVFARAGLARAGRLQGEPAVLGRALDQLDEVGGSWERRVAQGLLDPAVGFTVEGYAAAALLPSSARMDKYYADTEAKHFFEDGVGSVFTREKSLPELLTTAHAQRGAGLAGDDREQLIAQGVPAESLLPQCRYLQVETPGTNGLVRLDELPGETRVQFLRTKEGSPCSAVVEVAERPTVSVATIIIGPDQDDPSRECVWTAHPGLPVRPAMSEREPGETTVAQLRAEDPARLWVQAKVSP